MKLTDYLAIYAAALSTWVFFWNVRRSKPNVKVRLILGTKEDELAEKYEVGLYVFVQNPSAHQVHLAGLTLYRRYEKTSVLETLINTIKYKRYSRSWGWVGVSPHLYGISDGFPVTIESGKSYSVFMANEKVEEVLEDSVDGIIMASVQDHLWHNKYSKPFPFRPIKHEHK